MGNFDLFYLRFPNSFFLDVDLKSKDNFTMVFNGQCEVDTISGVSQSLHVPLADPQERLPSDSLKVTYHHHRMI